LDGRKKCRHCDFEAVVDVVNVVNVVDVVAVEVVEVFAVLVVVAAFVPVVDDVELRRHLNLVVDGEEVVDRDSSGNDFLWPG
jgi:hypothetical protein